MGAAEAVRLPAQQTRHQKQKHGRVFAQLHHDHVTPPLFVEADSAFHAASSARVNKAAVMEVLGSRSEVHWLQEPSAACMGLWFSSSADK